MNRKQRKWILASQEWYFLHAVKYSKELPFGQPPIEFGKCLTWYRKAKKWYETGEDVSTKKATLPPPPPPPPPED